MIRAAIFDLDGTLVDMFEGHLWAYGEASKRLNMPAMTRAFFEKHYGQTGIEIVRQFLGKPEIDEAVRKLANAKREAFLSSGVSHIKALPGAVELVTELYSRKIPMAIASSARKPEIQAALKKIGVDNKMKYVVSADDVRNSKPHPEVFLKAAGNLNVPPENCLVFEDSLHGVEAAKAAGMKCVAVATGTTPRKELEKLKPDVVVDNLEEIVARIDEVLKQ